MKAPRIIYLVVGTVMLFQTALIGSECWLRIAGVAVTAFLAVEFEKWIRFGPRRNSAQKV